MWHRNICMYRTVQSQCFTSLFIFTFFVERHRERFVDFLPKCPQHSNRAKKYRRQGPSLGLPCSWQGSRQWSHYLMCSSMYYQQTVSGWAWTLSVGSCCARGPPDSLPFHFRLWDNYIWERLETCWGTVSKTLVGSWLMFAIFWFYG